MIKKLTNLNMNKKISIDHLHLNKIIDLGLFKIPLQKIKFMMIMREPIDRFISICNYHFQIFKKR